MSAESAEWLAAGLLMPHVDRAAGRRWWAVNPLTGEPLPGYRAEVAEADRERVGLLAALDAQRAEMGDGWDAITATVDVVGRDWGAGAAIPCEVCGDRFDVHQWLTVAATDGLPVVTCDRDDRFSEPDADGWPMG